MTSTDTPSHQDAISNELSKDDLFYLLSNSRRRATLHYLNDHDGSVDMRDLAEWIAAQEHDTPVPQLHSQERQRVYIPLYQSHLPALSEHGVIEYNQSRGIVRRTDLADQLDPYLDRDMAADGDEASMVNTMDWPRRSSARYSLGIVVIAIMTFTIGWAGLLPTLLLLVLTWITLVTVLLRPQSTGLFNRTLSLSNKIKATIGSWKRRWHEVRL